MLDNPWLLISGMLVSLLGAALFVYGKRGGDLRCLVTGAFLSVFPCFVHSVLIMWLIAAACGVGLYWWKGAE